jgi:hypothetical protein
VDRLGTFDFFFDVGCFQHFDAGQRVGAGRGITALANLGATLLMMAFSRSTPIRSFVKAVSPDDVQAAFPSWGRAAHGPVEVVVDQPASIGALPVAVAQDMGSDTAYLPGLAMPNRRSASGNGQDRCPGCLCHRRCCAHPAVDRYRGARDGGPGRVDGSRR